MIHEEICTYEVCKLAKEKGFDVPTFGYYRIDTEDWYRTSVYNNWNESTIFCSAPTQSLLQRWLRDEKAVHIQITLWEKGWYYDIWVFEYYEEEKEYGVRAAFQSRDFNTYELALEDALKYALENLV